MSLLQAVAHVEIFTRSDTAVHTLKRQQLLDLFPPEVAEHIRSGASAMDARSAHSGGSSWYSGPSGGWVGGGRSGSPVPSGSHSPNQQAMREAQQCSTASVWISARNLYSHPPTAVDLNEHVTR
jgi:hypothetical protein